MTDIDKEPFHYKLALLCEDSYDQHTLKKNGVEVYLKSIDGIQCLAFRGTEVLKDCGIDVLRDIWFTPCSWLGLVGHSGFISGARNISNQVNDLLNKDDPVHITGHSLGGGLAIVMALYLRLEGYKIDGLTTFGAPRVISKGFEYFDDINVTQYEYGDDVVPTYQFWTPRKHINTVHIGPPRHKNWLWHRTWDDHGINSYQKAVYAHCFFSSIEEVVINNISEFTS